ncbi:MAG: ornithine cyclodeaminase family protein [Arenicellales bacterium WSBS_2016_MAG_OTU3]
MKVIDFDQVISILDFKTLIDGLDRLHKQPTQQLKDLLLTESKDGGLHNHLLVRAAWQHGKALGVKLATVFPANRDQGKPAMHGVYIYFDGATGQPLASIDGSALTWRKTAGDSGLGARYLARENSEKLLMVGAGSMATHLIQAHTTVRPSITQVNIWNRTRANAEKLADQLTIENADINADINVVDDLAAAVSEADIVTCATMTTDPIIKGAWLTPGTHLDLVGAFTPTMREADDACLQRSNIFVDSRLTTIGEIGEIVIPMESGVIEANDVLADLYDLCNGKHAGRQSEDAITIFKNGGGGHLDLMTATVVLEQNQAALKNL